MVISEHVGFSAHGWPERCESALQNPRPREPQAPGAPQAHCGFRSVLSQCSGRHVLRTRREVEAASFQDVAEESGCLYEVGLWLIAIRPDTRAEDPL